MLMLSGNYYQDNPDLQAHVEHFIDWDEIVEQYEADFGDARKYQETGDEKLAFAPSSTQEAVDYYKQILESYGDFCGNEIAPIAAEMGAISLPQKSR